MRGGTANCTVIIADEEIGSPMVKNPGAVIAFNQPSLEKYEALMKPGGVLVINQSMVDKKVTRKDLKVIYIDANVIAEKIGDKRMTNMVLLGGLLANLPVLPIKAIEKALEQHLPERHKNLLPLNYQALKEGASHKD
jgi:2-oxoglutarate ferredoxin oxidoreductase subunit gamma